MPDRNKNASKLRLRAEYQSIFTVMQSLTRTKSLNEKSNLIGERYKVVGDSLGEGAFGAVMRCVDEKDPKKVEYAVKKVPIAAMVGEGVEYHMKNEIALMR